MELFKLLNVTIVGVNGVEADDLASLLVHKFSADPTNKITLITGDYDWLHMVIDTSNVRLFDFPKDDFIYHKDIFNKYGVRNRRQFSIKKSIVGDKSDNIKFIKNLAEVKGTSLFELIHEKYQDPTDDDIIAEIELYTSDKPAMSLYKHHIEDGRTTFRDAYLSNMKIADPFTTTDNMSEEQIIAFNECLNSSLNYDTPDPLEFSFLAVKIFGYPVVLNDIAKKVFYV
jgi:hypothetical protein